MGSSIDEVSRGTPINDEVEIHSPDSPARRSVGIWRLSVFQGVDSKQDLEGLELVGERVAA